MIAREKAMRTLLLALLVAAAAVVGGLILKAWGDAHPPADPVFHAGEPVILMDPTAANVWLRWAEPTLTVPAVAQATRALYMGGDTKGDPPRPMHRIVIDEGDLKGVTGWVEGREVIRPPAPAR
jgi:hypothetical protein